MINDVLVINRENIIGYACNKYDLVTWTFVLNKI